ncbi:hypothetical protein OSTOST_08598 [Ostertagia ostertagi]
MDIWNLAKEKLRQNEDLRLRERLDDKNSEGGHEKSATHMIICGNSQSGKSTMVNKFLDRKRGSQRDRSTGNKDVCHIWELGGGTKLVQLLAIPLVKENIESASIVLVLDLTRPYELWITMEALMSGASSYVETAIKNLPESRQAKIRNRMAARVAEYKVWSENLPGPNGNIRLLQKRSGKI